MRMRSTSACVLMLCGAAFAADPVPTLEELEQLKQEQKWPDLLKATTRVLSLKPDGPRAAERPQVWLLKAEGQIQTRQMSPASESFESAAKDPALPPDQKDTCLAMALLTKKSTGTGYRPPVTKADPSPDVIDILDPAKRPEAIKKLFEVEFDEVSKSLTRAKDPSMGAMTKIAKDAIELLPLERAAVGGTARIDALLKEISTSVVKTGIDWADKQTQEIDRIVKAADEKILVEPKKDKKGDKPTIRRRGITGEDERTLETIIRNCEGLAGSYKKLVDAMGETRANDLSDLPPAIEKLHSNAKTTLSSERNIKRTAS